MNHSVVLMSNMTKQLREPNKHSNKYLTEALGKNWATVVVWIAVLSVTLPIFRSGGRTNMNLWGWIANHSVFGKPVEYIPIEDYVKELEGTWIDETGLHW